LAKIESGRSNGTLDVSARNLPETGLEYVRRLREVKYHETLFELLSRQYEAARIDEAKLAPVIQVVDSAIAPDKKSWPPRALFVMAAGVLALIGACFVALFQDHRRSMRAGR
jgi:tyrosine-protein kinase Etk/Wzc